MLKQALINLSNVKLWHNKLYLSLEKFLMISVITLYVWVTVLFTLSTGADWLGGFGMGCKMFD